MLVGHTYALALAVCAWCRVPSKKKNRGVRKLPPVPHPNAATMLGPWLAHRAACIEAFKSELPNLVCEFHLEGFQRELTKSMDRALDEFVSWNLRHGALRAGLGPKQDVKALAGHLKKVLQLLEKPGIRNRLHLAAFAIPPSTRPARPVDPLEWEFSSTIFQSPSRSAANIRGLLAITEQARTIDGRQLNALTRGDLRAAARPLYRFWVKVAKKPPELRQWGDVCTLAVKFLHACLILIDHNATRRLIAEFDFPTTPPR